MPRLFVSIPRRFVHLLLGATGFFAFFLIFIIIALGGPDTELAEISRVFGAFERVPPATSATIGGDLAIAPPRIVQSPPALPVLKGHFSEGQSFTAASVVVKDEASGIVLLRKNEYKRHPIASITKLMSALVLLERPIDWQATVTVVPDPVSDTHLYSGDIYTVRDIWRAGLIGSSNKAVLTLVDTSRFSREAFVKRMNEKARELGLLEAIFVDPTGLEEGNTASAADVALLLEEALRQDEIRNTLVMKDYTLVSKERRKNHHFWNTNWLLLGWTPHNFEKINGGKTGYIPASGYNVAVQVMGSEGQVLDVVVLGAPTNEARFTEARDAADWVFAHYEWPKD